MNRSKVLYLGNRVSEKLWREVCNNVQEAVSKPSGCTKRLYKELRKEEKRRAREKGEDIPN